MHRLVQGVDLEWQRAATRPDLISSEAALMSQIPQAQVLVTQRPDGSFAVLDALEREHYAADVRELGDVLAKLVHDTDLPEPTVTSTTQVLLEDGFTQVARRVTGSELEGLAVAAGRAGAAVSTRAANAFVEAAKGMWDEWKQKKAQPKPAQRVASRPDPKKNGTNKKRASSLRFPEDR